ncbi:MAG: glycosyltransferase [Paracoccaceae bacterium]
MSNNLNIGAVIIGRNEGQRLAQALLAAKKQVSTIVYVDSGSTDGSQDLARSHGAEVVDLDLSQPFTAARARNTGLARLTARVQVPDYVQFIDGDCELQADWIETARAFLNARPKVAVVCGRRRERFPQASIYNRLIDQEWATPVGEALACGGDALMRIDALKEVDGFNGAMIAGEEPELCIRLRAAGWSIWRLDSEMTLHDADIQKLSQWWRRNRRAGHAFAEGAALHGLGSDHHNIRPVKSILFWAFFLPLFTIFAAVLAPPWGGVLFFAWPAQVLRLARRDGDWASAFFLTMGKFPEMQGIWDYGLHRLQGRRRGLIEYK